jgi:1,4-alpha-glucan branching enzyme
MKRTVTDRAGVDDATIAAIVSGDHGDPFAVLGMHEAPGGDGALMVRAFAPDTGRLWVVDARDGSVVGELPRLHGAGFFAGLLHDRGQSFHYRLRSAVGKGGIEFEDPYRFPPILTEAELQLFKEGNHLSVHQILGAHCQIVDGVSGVVFAVWAPNARRVSVVGGFNLWDGRRHPMRLRPECGVWEIFIPGIGPGELYKFEIKCKSGEVLPLKADPCGVYAEHPPATASIVFRSGDFEWRDETWMAQRARANARDAPISIYEVHLGSWRRGGNGRYLTYREIADQLAPYVGTLGFTHIELLPVSEHPFDGSWGYQPVGLFAPTSRFGTPDDFRYFVQRCHEAGIGVLLDWVPAHFPGDPHGLGFFDGTCLYEHADPRKGLHPDWRTLIYNFGRREVAAFLISNALYWVREFHVDGLRVDAVASMLYLDYSRKPGEWLPNEHGGRENLEALAFLRRLNETIYAEGQGAITVAEESTAWPMVSRPTYLGGLGFGYKWNLGWMHDTLRYMGKDPVHRRYHHGDITFGLLYAFSENFVLPLSHDEVVHGKGSLIQRMPGDTWQKFANLRLYYAFLYTQPGKKLLFMGGEFAQFAEWTHERELDWDLLHEPMHRRVQSLVADLNRLYRGVDGLHQADCEAEGFEWIDCDDVEQSVVAYLRRTRDGNAYVAAVCNFTPVVRRNYRMGVPFGGRYREVLNTDAAEYGGSGVGNAGTVEAEAVAWHGRPYSLALTLPPLAALVLQPER